MGRRNPYLGRRAGPIGYDRRTGLKVPLRDLIEDEEYGIMTTPRNADARHPQESIYPAPPDRMDRGITAPANPAIPKTMRVGRLFDVSTMQPIPVKGLSLGYCPIGVTIAGIDYLYSDDGDLIYVDDASAQYDDEVS